MRLTPDKTHLFWFPSVLSVQLSDIPVPNCCPLALPCSRVLLQLSVRAPLLPSLKPPPSATSRPTPRIFPNALRAVLIKESGGEEELLYKLLVSFIQPQYGLNNSLRADPEPPPGSDLM